MEYEIRFFGSSPITVAQFDNNALNCSPVRTKELEKEIFCEFLKILK
jgi:hypothetical protein